MAPPKTVVSIGNFDGVHLGHQALMTRARALATDSGRVVAISFNPHPAAVLRPDAAPPILEPFARRVERLKAASADDVVALDPRSGVLELTPEAFIDTIVAEHAPTAFVEGHDFRFGKSRAGNAETLKTLTEPRGIHTEIMGPVNAVLTNQHTAEVSSSLVRWCLDHGRVRDAAYLLGRHHEIRGQAVRGDQLGRTIGFPTINLDTPCMRPARGVYAATATVGDQRTLAAVNIGVRPSVSGDATPRIEAHLINDDGSPWTPPPTLPEYGFDATLDIIGWVRDEIRFEHVDALRAQIARDIRAVTETLAPAG